MAAAIDQGVNDAAIRRGAGDLGRKIRAEGGIEKGVALIERFEDAYVP